MVPLQPADLLGKIHISPRMVRYKALHVAEGAPARTDGAVPVGAPETRVERYFPQCLAEHLPEIRGQRAVEKGALTLFSSSASHLRSSIQKL